MADTPTTSGIDWTGVLQTGLATAVQAGAGYVLGNKTAPSDTTPSEPPANTLPGAPQTQQNQVNPNPMNPYLIYGAVGLVLLVVVVVIAKR